MSVHINAEKGAIAETVLLPGDPLRAKFVAEKYLDNPVCFNEVRNMFGYTGEYKGKRVSVMGTGMGQASLSIYVNELLDSYGVKKLIRIGSCGAMQKDLALRDIVLAMTSSTDSSMNKLRFKGLDYAPAADFDLLLEAFNGCLLKGQKPHVGGVLSTDNFYHPDKNLWKTWAEYNVLAVDMETSALYTLAAQKGAQALSLLTVSDSLVTGKETTSQEREQTFTTMAEVALDLA